VVFDEAAFGATAVLGSCRVGEMPLYERCSGDEWYVVEVDYLLLSAHLRADRGGQLTLRRRSNFGCAHVSQYYRYT
jgi:hypothetical protein